MTEIQEKLNQMLKWFHNYCDKHNLRYYIIEGTVIGALRHKGFIPWDDDVDVGMPRHDYDLLMRVLGSCEGLYKLETPYSNNPDYICPWCKLFDTTTTKIEKTRYNKKFGIYIDIFPLDGLGNAREQIVANYKGIDRLVMLWATRVCAIRKGRGLLKNAAIIVSRLIPNFIIDNKKLVMKIDERCKKIDFDSSEYVICGLSTYRYKEIMKRDIYGIPKLYSFNDFAVYGPENADEYLTTIYGNWRKLPPLDKQINNHDYIYLNLNESYISR